MLRAMKEVPKEKALRVFFEKAGLEKVGQFLSFWPEVPAEVRAELAHLQDDIAPSDLEEVKRTIRAELAGGPGVEYLIAHLDPKPLGSGSIGECYRSQLPNGEAVVVKVITPSKEARFRKAMERVAKVRRLLGLYQGRIAGAGEACRVIDMFLAMVNAEFNLRNEAMTVLRIERASGRPANVRIPRYHGGLTREKVAVQSLVTGLKLKDLADARMKARVLGTLQSYLLQGQVLGEGLYHSDLQPGNILVDPRTGDIWLLDFGQTGELDVGARSNIAAFMMAFGARDLKGMAAALEAMSEVTEASYDQAAFERSLGELLVRRPLDMSRMSGSINEIFHLCNERGLLIGLKYVKLLKGLATFEATMRDGS